MTPTTLNDLKTMQNVFEVDTSGTGIQFEAERIFYENFGELYRPDLTVSVRYLFCETNSEDQQVKVYEAYKDSGSDDYVYLVATL